MIQLFPIYHPDPDQPYGYRVGFMDREGRCVIQPQFESAYPFREGLAAVRVNSRWGYIDVFGDLVIKPRLENGDLFYEGRASSRQDQLQGYIDRNGCWVVEPTCEITSSFENGYAWAMAKGKFGFFDLQGRVALPFDFDDARQFALGVAPVKTGELWGYVNPSGQFEIGPIHAKFAAPFRCDLARVQTDEGWGFIDRNGDWAVRPMLDLAFDFNEGLAPVKTGDLFGYLGTKGEHMIAPEFTRADHFSGGFAAVRRTNCTASDGIQFIDRAGKRAFPGMFSATRPFSSGLAYVETRDFIGYINSSGEYVWRAPYINLNLPFDTRW